MTITSRASLLDLSERPRRLRRTPALRAFLREAHLAPSHLILPLFVHDGEGREFIRSMPGVSRLSVGELLREAEAASNLGVTSIALFPRVPDERKDKRGTEATNPNGLFQRAIRELKREFPHIAVVTDIALDPYSTDGHDGLLSDAGEILNDETVELLARIAVSQAQAGADVVAPSDMMDGRIGAIRAALDDAGFQHVAIMAYSTKYASGYYGPFRDALDSAPRGGDKKTYQMDPLGSYREALRESRLDVEQGADFLMVKPALAYLDVLRVVRDAFDLPVVAYNVSGEYAMVKAAALAGYVDERKVVLETLGGMRRAGADGILTYHALDAARWLKEEGL
ncbi:porphobilinogen synthase [Deinococcus yavapaiensis]|uniref:Delta-aminolevulinic acid dehydratase n=1 Tax=Deinococcus yavapaiensis KR-236 TaxID=694435 RepID=A0A318SC96_9DEIO|nr:porphobilinogen synthase [Deinococcus yavapaiensis]PYE56461.1 porphobilinogen synthase [Deinococcus yavapaiensis KR-236]